MIAIKFLADTSFDTLYEAWQDAFSEYEKTWTKDEMIRSQRRRGYSAELSFGAFDGESLVSCICNCRGVFGGVSTIYDSGTGTIKSYRGQGLTARVFWESLPYLRLSGAQQYLLEVLQHNAAAVKVYTNAGFNVTRELNYFVGEAADVKPAARTLPEGLRLHGVGLDNLETVSAMWDFEPSWQNGIECIQRNPGDFLMVGVSEGERLVGYGIIEPETGDVPQIAVNKVFRRRGVGNAIYCELLKLCRSQTVKVINTDVKCAGVTSFFECMGMPLRGRQYEMMLRW